MTASKHAPSKESLTKAQKIFTDWLFKRGNQYGADIIERVALAIDARDVPPSRQELKAASNAHYDMHKEKPHAQVDFEAGARWAIDRMKGEK